MRVEIASFRPYSKNTLKGFLTMRLPDAGLLLKECTWHEKDGKEWIGFPAREFTDKEGNRKWQNLIEFLEGFDRNGFQSAAVKAIYAHLGSGGHPLPGDKAPYRPPPVERGTQLRTPDANIRGKGPDEDLPF